MKRTTCIPGFLWAVVAVLLLVFFAGGVGVPLLPRLLLGALACGAGRLAMRAQGQGANKQEGK